MVVGYGPTGEAVGRRLKDAGFAVHVVDLNRRLLQGAVANGHTAHLGDATHPEVLEHAAVDRAIAIAVTLPDPSASRRSVEQVRALAPGARRSSSGLATTVTAALWRRPVPRSWSTRRSRWAAPWRTS